jgi:hypothetical protein
MKTTAANTIAATMCINASAIYWPANLVQRGGAGVGVAAAFGVAGFVTVC